MQWSNLLKLSLTNKSKSKENGRKDNHWVRGRLIKQPVSVAIPLWSLYVYS